MGCFFAFIVMLFATSQAAYGFGLGLVVGQPSGVSFKSDALTATAFDGAISWNIGDNNTGLDLTGDYIWHEGRHVYYGLGARIRTSSQDDGAGGGKGGKGKGADAGGKKPKDKKAALEAPPGKFMQSDVDIAPRVPFGVRHYFGSPAVEVFGEVAALIGIIPEFDLDVGLAIGARYFF